MGNIIRKRKRSISRISALYQRYTFEEAKKLSIAVRRISEVLEVYEVNCNNLNERFEVSNDLVVELSFFVIDKIKKELEVFSKNGGQIN